MRVIKVLYFAALREALGLGEEILTLPPEVRTVKDLAALLEASHAALGGRLGAVRIAVNEAFADDDENVSDGDVVALIPPVSGG